MTQLNKDNFRSVAMTAYDNPYCLSEKEFDDDLKKITVIRRMLSDYINNSNINTRLLINYFISFYNVFEHKTATHLLLFRLSEVQKPYINSVLMFLNLPILDTREYDESLYQQITELYRNA